MSTKINLKGIAWDHPRGYEPLRATSKVFSEIYGNVSLDWDIRSLKEFGDMPIEDLIETYDLITIDHPYMGQAHKNKLLLPLEKSMEKNVLQELEDQSIGPSFRSYRYEGHLYALPIDAAALVAASRNDLLTDFGTELPQTRTELFEFYKTLPCDYAVAWPLCATDLWCTFLTFCVQDTGEYIIQGNGIDEKVGAAVLNELKEHIEFLHPESLNWNPIQILDKMAAEDEIVYSPYLFGYTNYSRKGYAKNVLKFSNSPINPEHNVSTILGGVGLAVSATCKHPKWAISYATFTARGFIQKGLYTRNGGQPANSVAWKSKANNILCNNFFKNTSRTMANAYVRPQHPGWNRFQEQGADLLHEALVNDTASDQVMKVLNQLFKSIVKWPINTKTS